jgi:hypothetical protein
MASRQRDELIRPTYKEDVAAYQERASTPLDQGQEGRLEFACAACIQHHKVYAENVCRGLYLSCFGRGKTGLVRKPKISF